MCLCCVCVCMWGGEEGRVGAKEREREGGRVRMNRESDNKLTYTHGVTEMNKTDLIPNVNLSRLLS